MGMKDNITAVRGNLENHAQDLFIQFFTKYPAHLSQFPKWKGQDVASLKQLSSFPDHTGKVVGMLLEIAERSSGGVPTADDIRTLREMQQHKKLSADHFRDLFAALVPYLKQKLGAGCDTVAWETLGTNLVAGLREAGM